MRLFLGVGIPEKAKKEISLQIDHLKKEYPQFDWVPEENYHITVHFFGDIDSVESINKQLEELLFDRTSFHMYSFGLDIFVSNRITIYMEFIREKNLESIAKNMKNTFSLSDDNMKYVPHLTLARYRLPSKQQYFVLKKKFPKEEIDISYPVKNLVLFESINAGNFPKYKPLKKYSLL